MKKEEVYSLLNDAYFSEDCHERAALSELEVLLSGKKLFIDVGASLGQYSKEAARVLRDSGARIVGVEADVIRYEELGRNYSTWAEEFGVEMKAHHGAAAASEEILTFFTTGSNISGSLTPADDLPDSEGGDDLEPTDVQGLMLDRIVADLGDDPDLVKMDIEGGEAGALVGASEILKRGKTDFWIELHPWAKYEDKDVVPFVYELMREHGYQWVAVHQKTYFSKSLPKKYRAMAFWRNLKRPLRRLRSWISGGGKTK